MKLRTFPTLAAGLLGVLLLSLALACGTSQSPTPFPPAAVSAPPTIPPEFLANMSFLEERATRLAEERDALKAEERDYLDRLDRVDLEVKEQLAAAQELEGEQVEQAQEESQEFQQSAVESVIDEWELQQQLQTHLEMRLEQAKSRQQELADAQQELDESEGKLRGRNERDAFEAEALRRARLQANQSLQGDILERERAESRFQQEEETLLGEANGKLKDLQDRLATLRAGIQEATTRTEQANARYRTVQQDLAQATACGPALYADLSSIARYPLVQQHYPQEGDVPMTGFRMSGSISTALAKCGR